jgi:hypothetical protein
VEEVKKDISKRKSHASGKIPTPMELINSEFFQASDKRQVIENLMSNENVLLFIYEKLFPKKSDPIVKDLKVNDSYVFLGDKMRMRGSHSVHPMLADQHPTCSFNFGPGNISPSIKAKA